MFILLYEVEGLYIIYQSGRYLVTVVRYITLTMKEEIVKNGTKVILFALDTEGDLDNLMRKDFEVVTNKFSNFCFSTVFYGEA